ncbi:hypothetical protein V1525DRAFT_229833 [Lipomyces kononenkoae]|uniref:Uncharacterized protein n=1 Tax=Lipomyces kononenkoae TaxID=34357 RepID=A0ACC3T8U5_LIPKO
MSIFAICFPCCISNRKRRHNPAPDRHPSYYSDFNFYAEQMREGGPRPRRVSSLDSISLVGNDDDNDADELTELLSARRGGRPRSRRSWFEGWFPWVSSGRSRHQRSYNAMSTMPSKSRTRTPSLISTASFLVPSRRNSVSTFYSDEADDSNGDGSRSEHYEDFGLADAQIVPDNFVVSVPLRPTKSTNTLRSNDDPTDVSTNYDSVREGSFRSSSIHSEEDED